MKLVKILEKINNGEKDFKEFLLDSAIGEDFKNNLIKYLSIDSSYKEIDLDELKSHSSYGKMKDIVMNGNPKNTFHYIEEFEDLSKEPRIVFQPFGTQNSPQILIIKNGQLLPIDIKFTKKKVASPMFNSAIPKTSYIYIFGSYELKDITFFKGSDFISEEISNKFMKIISNQREKLKAEVSNVDGNKYYEIYLRPDYKLKVNLWENEDRNSIESEVIKILEIF